MQSIAALLDGAAGNRQNPTLSDTPLLPVPKIRIRQGQATIDYGKRYRAGKPISTAMAESAVNQVLNARMCKSQQMRWTPRGAHLLAQVRCAVINGDFTAKLKAYKAEPEEIPEEVTRFLDLLQRAAA